MTRLAIRARESGLLARGARVVVGVSGGADSVALLFVLRELAAHGDITIAGIAHLNHLLRGADSDADEAFCAALAARLGVAFAAERIDVAALARTEKRSIEDAARTARYAFFERAANRLRADVVAVGHTQDDQAETFLLRLLRGAGARGLGSIRPVNGRIIRPLLEVERSALRDYLREIGEPFREDASNADVAFARNRVRHELIPLLQSRFSPGISEILARDAALARQDEEFLAGEAIKLASRIVLQNEPVTIDAMGLRQAPRALSSRVAHAALQRSGGAKSIHFEHVQQLLELADGPAGPARGISLPGQDAVRVGETIVLRPRQVHGTTQAPGWDHPGTGLGSPRHQGGGNAGQPSAPGRGSDGGYAIVLPVPGEVELGLAGFAIGAEPLPGTFGANGRPNHWTARGMEVGVAAGALALPLGVRTRRPGDRFRPLGAPGRRKLQDFLVDRKVPREARDRLPLVVDRRDRIVWVVGQSVAEEFRVTDPSQGVILLKVRHLGGVG